MNRLKQFISKIKSSSGFFLVLVLVSVYFTFYAVRGERGLIKYINLNKEVSDARASAEKYALEKQEWDQKVRRLSPQSLDLDMLEERARVVLNMAGDREFVIFDSDLED
ncbi:MAG: septum formation initiator family protein [Alphaproteobacteria bacterium]|nr:septum formation initiator family protein [Alphaproteobacteria bacterium]